MSTNLDSSDTRSAKQREKEKSAQEHAEDVAYTVNHALSCGATDILVQPLAATFATALVQEELLPKKWHGITKFFEHHHDHDHGHGHSHTHGTGEACSHTPVRQDGLQKFRAAAPTEPTKRVAEDLSASGKWNRVGSKIRSQLRPKQFLGNLSHWVAGETVGDAGGVIPTILVQRSFPSFMEGMRKVLEPIARPFFRNGAERDARKWGKRQGLAADAPEVKEKEAYFYEHEMSHLPQAVVWNGFSIPINFGVQYLTHGNHKSSNWRKAVAEMLPGFIVGKGFGTFFSNGILLGGRAVAPDAFIAWDRWNSKTFIKPTLGALGIDRKTIDRVTSEDTPEQPKKQWQKQEDTRREETPESAEISR